MKKVVLDIDGMTCAACSARIDKVLNSKDGIAKASTNLVMHSCEIEYDEDIVSLDDIEKYISDAGYKSLGIYKDNREEKDYHKDKVLLIVFGILVIISLLSMLKIPFISNNIVLFIIAVTFLVYGKDIIINGIKSIIKRNPNMNSLVSMGVLTSFIYSTIIMMLNSKNYVYFDSVIMIIYIVKIGRYIDSISKEKTKEAIKGLVTITPTKALIKEGHKEIEVSVGEVTMSDTLVCKPGMRIAVDGVIVSGNTHTDESFINGESVPVKKKEKDEVIAGSINIDGYIEYKPIRIGPDTTISSIVNLVKESSNTKPSIAKIADRVCSYFVPIVFIIACITLIIHLVMGKEIGEAIIYFVNVLVVTCPCALGLATPLAVIVSIGNCANNGILVRNSNILETTSKVDTVMFDKTGTLTKGRLEVTECITYSDYKEDELINIVANLESKSNHPIALAFKNYIKSEIKILSYKEFPGIGFKGGIGKSSFYVGNDRIFKEFKLEKGKEQEVDEKRLAYNGNSIVYVFENKKLIGLIGVKDTIKEEVKEVIDEIRKDNIKVVMLTGDNKDVAMKIGDMVGISNIEAGLLPKDKTDIVKKYLKKNKIVMFIGDGINDAPVLSMANIGVSVAKSTDIAANSSDVVLLKDDMSSINKLFSIGKKTVNVIKMNLFWAFFYNIIMIPIAMGLFKFKINPIVSALAMMLSSITVILNSLRLKR